ncbi:hypothetical protein ACLB2K_059409 [Fragaria x ananassa]
MIEIDMPDVTKSNLRDSQAGFSSAKFIGFESKTENLGGIQVSLKGASTRGKEKIGYVELGSVVSKPNMIVNGDKAQTKSPWKEFLSQSPKSQKIRQLALSPLSLKRELLPRRVFAQVVAKEKKWRFMRLASKKCDEDRVKSKLQEMMAGLLRKKGEARRQWWRKGRLRRGLIMIIR